MADGSQGGLGGVLFEAGKTISDAGKKQAQATANAIGGQLGAQKPLFGGQKPASSGTSGGQTPKVDPFGDFGKMFEGGKMGGLGPKKPPVPPTQQFSQADLDKMAADNKVIDDQKIAAAQAELQALKQKRKELHDEVYYNAIKNTGQNSIAQERQQKAEEEQQEEAARQQAQASQQQDILPGSPLAKNQQLGDPIHVQQAKTQTEANRGTTG